MSPTTVPSAGLFLSVVALVPMALRLVAERERDGRRPRVFAAACVAAIPGGIAAAIAIVLPPGTAAGLMSTGWAAATALFAVHGLLRLVGRGLRPAHEVAVSAGLVNLGVGGVWLTLSCAGATPLGFSPLIVELTAVHFHVAGFVLPACIGMLGRHRRSRLVAASAVLVVVSVPLTAVGIATTRGVEVVAATLLTVGGATAGVGIVIAARHRAAAARALLVTSGLALVAAMPLALVYALGWPFTALTLGELSPIDIMGVTHGVLNLVGFALAGLAGWGLEPPPAAPPLPPFSRLASASWVGADFFLQSGAVSNDAASRPTGLVDQLEDLAHHGCSTARVHPAVRAFYEHTDVHALTVYPSWARGSRLGGRIWARLARRLGQLQLPVAAQRADAIASSIVALDGARDGRSMPRGWTRSFGDGRAMYVAAYSTHRAGDVAYMNIAFPLPRANLASILRMENGTDGGVVLTTRNPRGQAGDAGIWLVLLIGGRSLPIKLPMAETIEVWPVGGRGAPEDLAAAAPAPATVLARHRVWLLGIELLKLDYAIAGPTAPARDRTREVTATA